jgi:Na+/H+-translocating membrane pyrophosphatase
MVAFMSQSDFVSFSIKVKDENHLYAVLQISDAIRDGAEGFFKTQYGTISKMAVVLAFAILGIYTFRRSTPEQEASGLGR